MLSIRDPDGPDGQLEADSRYCGAWQSRRTSFRGLVQDVVAAASPFTGATIRA